MSAAAEGSAAAPSQPGDLQAALQRGDRAAVLAALQQWVTARSQRSHESLVAGIQQLDLATESARIVSGFVDEACCQRNWEAAYRGCRALSDLLLWRPTAVSGLDVVPPSGLVVAAEAIVAGAGSEASMLQLAMTVAMSCNALRQRVKGSVADGWFEGSGRDLAQALLGLAVAPCKQGWLQPELLPLLKFTVLLARRAAAELLASLLEACSPALREQQERQLITRASGPSLDRLTQTLLHDAPDVQLHEQLLELIQRGTCHFQEPSAAQQVQALRDAIGAGHAFWKVLERLSPEALKKGERRSLQMSCHPLPMASSRNCSISWGGLQVACGLATFSPHSFIFVNLLEEEVAVEIPYACVEDPQATVERGWPLVWAVDLQALTTLGILLPSVAATVASPGARLELRCPVEEEQVAIIHMLKQTVRGIVEGAPATEASDGGLCSPLLSPTGLLSPLDLWSPKLTPASPTLEVPTVTAMPDTVASPTASVATAAPPPALAVPDVEAAVRDSAAFDSAASDAGGSVAGCSVQLSEPGTVTCVPDVGDGQPETAAPAGPPTMLAPVSPLLMRTSPLAEVTMPMCSPTSPTSPLLPDVHMPLVPNRGSPRSPVLRELPEVGLLPFAPPTSPTTSPSEAILSAFSPKHLPAAAAPVPEPLPQRPAAFAAATVSDAAVASAATAPKPPPILLFAPSVDQRRTVASPPPLLPPAPLLAPAPPAERVPAKAAPAPVPEPAQRQSPILLFAPAVAEAPASETQEPPPPPPSEPREAPREPAPREFPIKRIRIESRSRSQAAAPSASSAATPPTSQEAAAPTPPAPTPPTKGGKCVAISIVGAHPVVDSWASERSRSETRSAPSPPDGLGKALKGGKCVVGTKSVVGGKSVLGGKYVGGKSVVGSSSTVDSWASEEASGTPPESGCALKSSKSMKGAKTVVGGKSVVGAKTVMGSSMDEPWASEQSGLESPSGMKKTVKGGKFVGSGRSRSASEPWASEAAGNPLSPPTGTKTVVGGKFVGGKSATSGASSAAEAWSGAEALTPPTGRKFVAKFVGGKFLGTKTGKSTGCKSASGPGTTPVTPGSANTVGTKPARKSRAASATPVPLSEGRTTRSAAARSSRSRDLPRRETQSMPASVPRGRCSIERSDNGEDEALLAGANPADPRYLGSLKVRTLQSLCRRLRVSYRGAKCDIISRLLVTCVCLSFQRGGSPDATFGTVSAETLSGMGRHELRASCEKLGLPSYGTVAMMVKRLLPGGSPETVKAKRPPERLPVFEPDDNILAENKLRKLYKSELRSMSLERGLSGRGNKDDLIIGLIGHAEEVATPGVEATTLSAPTRGLSPTTVRRRDARSKSEARAVEEKGGARSGAAPALPARASSEIPGRITRRLRCKSPDPRQLLLAVANPSLPAARHAAETLVSRALQEHGHQSVEPPARRRPGRPRKSQSLPAQPERKKSRSRSRGARRREEDEGKKYRLRSKSAVRRSPSPEVPPEQPKRRERTRSVARSEAPPSKPEARSRSEARGRSQVRGRSEPRGRSQVPEKQVAPPATASRPRTRSRTTTGRTRTTSRSRVRPKPAASGTSRRRSRTR